MNSSSRAGGVLMPREWPGGGTRGLGNPPMGSVPLLGTEEAVGDRVISSGDLGLTCLRTKWWLLHRGLLWFLCTASGSWGARFLWVR